MDPYSEPVRTFTPAVNSSACITRLLQVEMWTKEWEIKTARHHATSIVTLVSFLERELKALFQAARDEVFEDGMESEFSKRIISAVKEYGNNAVNALTSLIIYENSNEEIASEALRWLAYIQHSETHQNRLSLLVRSLDNPSVRMRNAASLGLASLDDPDAIPHLERAIKREPCDELRDDMQKILRQLEDTLSCRLSCAK